MTFRQKSFEKNRCSRIIRVTSFAVRSILIVILLAQINCLPAPPGTPPPGGTGYPPPEELAKIVSFWGDVKVNRGGNQINVYVNMPLELWDVVEARAGAVVEIEFPGVGFVKLISDHERDTQIQIQNPLIYINFGEVFFRLRASLPWGTRYVGGEVIRTEFTVKALPNNVVHVLVWKGAVEIFPRGGATWTPQVVDTRKGAVIQGTSPPRIDPIIG